MTTPRKPADVLVIPDRGASYVLVKRADGEVYRTSPRAAGVNIVRTIRSKRRVWPQGDD